MFKKISDSFAGLEWTIVSSIFLILSLLLLLTRRELPVDPAWVTIVLSGYPLLYLALTRLFKEKWISSALLISMAMIASLYVGEIFAAGEVAFIMSIGAILEDKTVERAKKGIKNLISLTPVQGRKLTSNTSGTVEEMIPAVQIQAGDILRILPGEAIPVDGEIKTGNTSVDQSIITGESLPVDKEAGDAVFCGTINRFGSIDIAATNVGKDSSLQKLIRMVQEAENKKAPIQRIADKWSVWLVPIALIIAICAFLSTGDLVRGVTVLVVFCPCALVLATPASVMAAIGQATKHGVIIKSGEALENMGKVDCIAFDKTGTLTEGKLVVADIFPVLEGIDERQLLTLASSAEACSEHPLAKAIVNYAKTQQISQKPTAGFRMFSGKGVTAVVDGEPLLCGTLNFLNENQIALGDSVLSILHKFQAQGKATILVAKDKALAGIITLSDTLRKSAPYMVAELHKMNTQVVLLTGDYVQTAEYFAEKAGIHFVKSELLPEDKVGSIAALEKQGRTVCMIGDGVNDAPALKTAHVGVAVSSSGSDIAVDAADIALVGDDIAKIPYLKRLSNTTVHTIKFNITLSMIINFVAIILSVAGILTPVSGALVHNAGSVLVVLNGALLYDRKLYVTDTSRTARMHA